MKKLLSLLTVLVLLSSCNYDNTQENVSKKYLNSTPDSIVVIKDTAEPKKDTIQCKAITKKGTQCKFMVISPDTLCHIHKK